MSSSNDRAKPPPMPEEETPRFLSVALGDDPAEWEAAAKAAGVTVEDLRKVIAFGEHLREEAMERDLIPPLIISATVNVIADVIKGCYPDEVTLRSELVTALFHQLWHALDLPNDTIQ